MNLIIKIIFKTHQKKKKLTLDLLVNLVNLVNLLVKLVVYVLFEKLMYKEKQHEKNLPFRSKEKSSEKS